MCVWSWPTWSVCTSTAITGAHLGLCQRDDRRQWGKRGPQGVRPHGRALSFLHVCLAHVVTWRGLGFSKSASEKWNNLTRYLEKIRKSEVTRNEIRMPCVESALPVGSLAADPIALRCWLQGHFPLGLFVCVCGVSFPRGAMDANAVFQYEERCRRAVGRWGKSGRTQHHRERERECVCVCECVCLCVG